MNTGIYLRQSLDVEDGIDRQRERTTAIVQARGWRLVDTYADNDTSASKARGTQTDWARMLRDIEAGRIDAVVAVDIDRLLRTTRDLNLLIERGAKVVTVDGEIDLSTADGEFRASMLASIARFEVRRKSERQKRANGDRAAQGQRIGGRRPFGYDPDGVTIREDEAEAVRWGFNALLGGGTLAGIAREWNRSGFVTGQTRQARSGHAGEPSPWTAGSVRTVLRNPRYCGLVRYNGEIQKKRAEWEAIVDEPTWLAAEAVLSNPARNSGAKRGRYLLSGIALCGVCGDGGTVGAGGNARQGVRAYRCTACYGHIARRAEPVENFVAMHVVARLSQPDAWMLTHRDAPDTAELQREAVGIRERLDALAVAFADGDLTASQLRSGTDRLRTNLEAVEGRLADAGRVSALDGVVGVEDVQAAWDALTIEQQRAVVDVLMTVTVLPPGRGTRAFRPETVLITWK